MGGRRFGGAGIRRGTRTSPAAAGGGGTDPATLTGLTSYYFEGGANTINTTPEPDTMSDFVDRSVLGIDASQATSGNQPQWNGGAPLADGTDDYFALDPDWDTVLDVDGYGCLAVIVPTGVQAAKGADYDAPAIYADSNAHVGLYVYGAGGQNYLYTLQRGGHHTGLTSVPIASSGSLVVAMGYDGSTVWCKSNGTTATNATTLNPNNTGQLRMFANWNASYLFAGAIRALYFYDAPKGTTDLDDGITWLQSTYGAT